MVSVRPVLAGLQFGDSLREVYREANTRSTVGYIVGGCANADDTEVHFTNDALADPCDGEPGLTWRTNSDILTISGPLTAGLTFGRNALGGDYDIITTDQVTGTIVAGNDLNVFIGDGSGTQPGGDLNIVSGDGGNAGDGGGINLTGGVCGTIDSGDASGSIAMTTRSGVITGQDAGDVCVKLGVTRGLGSQGSFQVGHAEDATGVLTEQVQMWSVAAGSIGLGSGSTVGNFRYNIFEAPRIEGISGGSAETVTNAATFYIEGDPVGTNVTFTNGPYAVWIDDGLSRFDGNLRLILADPSIIFDSLQASDTDFWIGVQDDAGSDDDDTFRIGDGTTPGTNSFVTIETDGDVGIGTTAPLGVLDVDPANRTSVTTEKSAILGSAQTHTLTSGTTLANQRQHFFTAPTINGVSGGAVERVTNAATLYVDAAPSGSNISFTNGPYAIWSDAGQNRLDGDVVMLGAQTISGTITLGQGTNTGVITFRTRDPAIVFDIPTAGDTDFWIGVQDDAGLDDDDLLHIGEGSTYGVSPVLTVDSRSRVGINDTTVSGTLTVGGHQHFSGTAPTVSACGGGSPSIVGTDQAGKVTTGTGVVTSCTLTFATEWTFAPACASNNETQILLTRSVTTSTTLVIDASLTFDEDVISYQCEGRE